MKNMKETRSSSAVSEIVGTMLLLILAVTAFSTIYLTVLSDEGPSPYIHNNIVSYVEGLDIVLEHQGGHPLSLDTTISIEIGPSDDTITVKDYLSAVDKADGKWNVGEQIRYNIDRISHDSCMYGSPALDYREVEIDEHSEAESSELNFSSIVKLYDGPTNISSLNPNIQWDSGTTLTEISAIDPMKNRIAFQGPLNVGHLIDYQEWHFLDSIHNVTLRFEYVNGSGGNDNKFFYYFNRMSSSKIIKNDLYNKVTDPGYVTDNITIEVEDNNYESIGFGIKSNSIYWYTNVPMNSNQVKQAVIYNLGKTTLGPEGSYLIGFEDLDRAYDASCDNDFQDLIVIVHIVDCS
jgi:hypothetical protein